MVLKAQLAALIERYLVIHAVDTIWPQQLDGLADQIGAAAVKHAKAQVQLELICGGFGIQPSEGTKATLGPRRKKRILKNMYERWTLGERENGWWCLSRGLGGVLYFFFRIIFMNH